MFASSNVSDDDAICWGTGVGGPGLHKPLHLVNTMGVFNEALRFEG